MRRQTDNNVTQQLASQGTTNLFKPDNQVAAAYNSHKGFEKAPHN